MLYGYDDIIEDLKRLTDNKKLAHAYLFFGESQTGKFLCAQSLARYIHEGIFDEPTGILSDAHTIEPLEGESAIGIDAVRELEHFLYRAPAVASYRVGIIRDGERLTTEAQNALLKLLEEPPHRGLVIMTVGDPAVLLPTVNSRFQHIFFPTLPLTRILDFLYKYVRISGSDATELAEQSFGRIGRARALAELPQERVRARQYAQGALVSSKTGPAIKSLTEEIIAFWDEHDSHETLFFEELIIRLQKDAKRSPAALRAVCETCLGFGTLTLNKRLHLKALLLSL